MKEQIPTYYIEIVIQYENENNEKYCVPFSTSCNRIYIHYSAHHSQRQLQIHVSKTLCYRYLARNRSTPISPFFCGYFRRLTPTSHLAEGGDEFAGHRLEFIIGQSYEMYPFGDIPHDFVNANREHHQLAVSQICSETKKKGHKHAEQDSVHRMLQVTTMFIHFILSIRIREQHKTRQIVTLLTLLVQYQFAFNRGHSLLRGAQDSARGLLQPKVYLEI